MLGYKAVEQSGIGMPVRHHTRFSQRQHPIGRRCWHASYAPDAEHLNGCFSVNPEIALVDQRQPGIASRVGDTAARMVDGYYCVLTSADIASRARDLDIAAALTSHMPGTASPIGSQMHRNAWSEKPLGRLA